MKESSYLQAIQTALHGAGLPYGYAVTISSTGAALAAEHGTPSLVEIYSSPPARWPHTGV